MTKYLTSLFLIIFSISCWSQSLENLIKKAEINLGEVAFGDEDFTGFSEMKEILEGVEIVMLGEQSHGEATAYETKIKLIKYLHQELGFDLLVFESGIYDCDKAWQLIEKGEDVRTAMGKSVFSLWSTLKDIIPLVGYIDKHKKSSTPLKVLGFDSQFSGKLSSESFLHDLSEFLLAANPEILKSNEWQHLETNFNFLTKFHFKQLKKNNPDQDLRFVDSLILETGKLDHRLRADYWRQMLKSAKVFLSDIALKTDHRDEQMAENLIWIKERNPNSKIICWGATSHFLYNSTEVRMKSPIVQLLAGNYYKKHRMMGDYVKEKYGNKVYTIGFTAYEGEYGLWRKKKLKKAKEKTLEHLLAQSKFDNYLLPFKGLNLDGYKSRPLGNFYMKNPIDEMMDAVIFNRHMKAPKLDRNFFLKIYPENKYIKPEPEAML